MAPTLHVVRHAQGFHNLSVENESLPDPDLTPFGEQQCAELRASFAHHDKVTKLVSSPLRRTLWTCINAFGGKDSLYPIIAVDTLQELSDAACDHGSPVAKLASEFGDRVDFSRVRDIFTNKGEDSPFEPEVTKVVARAREARRTLRELAGNGDDHIVVVAHGAIAHFLTDDWLDMPATGATAWKNCECRSYQFIDPTGLDEDAAIQETEESWRARKADGVILPTVTEQQGMRVAALRRMQPYLKIRA